MILSARLSSSSGALYSLCFLHWLSRSPLFSFFSFFFSLPQVLERDLVGKLLHISYFALSQYQHKLLRANKRFHSSY